MVQPKIQMIGKTFGRLTVLEQAEALKKERQAWYLCSAGRKLQCVEPACVTGRLQAAAVFGQKTRKKEIRCLQKKTLILQADVFIF